MGEMLYTCTCSVETGKCQRKFNSFGINCVRSYQISTSETTNMCRALNWFGAARVKRRWRRKWRHQCHSLIRCQVETSFNSIMRCLSPRRRAPSPPWPKLIFQNERHETQSVLKLHLFCCRHSFPAGRILVSIPVWERHSTHSRTQFFHTWRCLPYTRDSTHSHIYSSFQQNIN